MLKEDIVNIDWSGRSVLIVEDEEINYLFIKTLLSMTHATINHAWNGKQAVDRVIQDSGKIDLILMDIKMPIMDGYEATKEILALHPSLRIIAQTAFTLSDDRVKCLAAGCIDFITKPIRKKELLSIMEKYMS